MEYTYDDFLNACYAADAKVQLKRLEKEMPSKQFAQFVRRARAQSIYVPELEDQKEIETVTIRYESKFDKYESFVKLQSVANQFGRMIYDKSFTHSNYGAFGQAQNIQPSAKGKMITIVIPIEFEGTRNELLGKIMNSTNHYNRSGEGQCKIIYE